MLSGWLGSISDICDRSASDHFRSREGVATRRSPSINRCKGSQLTSNHHGAAIQLRVSKVCQMSLRSLTLIVDAAIPGSGVSRALIRLADTEKPRLPPSDSKPAP